VQTVVLARSNAGKLAEFDALLRDAGFAVVPQSAYAVEDAIEDGRSFVENALIKARHAAAHTGLPAIADDSGLCVDALGGRPGVHSARYAGPQAGDRENLELLLREISRTGEQYTAAQFRCAMAWVDAAADPDPVIVEAAWEGSIVREPAGDNGFGYDPVFFVPTHGCTSAQLPPAIKNRISHRGQALRGLLGALQKRLGAVRVEGG